MRRVNYRTILGSTALHRLADEQLPAILGDMHLEMFPVAQVHPLEVGHAGHFQHAIRADDGNLHEQLALDDALLDVVRQVHLVAFGLVLYFRKVPTGPPHGWCGKCVPRTPGPGFSLCRCISSWLRTLSVFTCHSTALQIMATRTS
jgi:hypothetical protein